MTHLFPSDVGLRQRSLYRLEVNPLHLDLSEIVTAFIPSLFAPLAITPLPFRYLGETPFGVIWANEITRFGDI